MEGKDKKVLLVYYKLFKPGGVAKVMTTLANELVAEGYKVEILLLMSPRPNFYPLNENVKIHHIDTFSHWAWKICEFNVKWLRFIPKIQNINAYIYHIGVYLMLKNWLGKNHQNYDTIISCWYKLSSFISLWSGVRERTIAWEHTDFNTGGFFYKGFLRRVFYKNLKQVVVINRPSMLHYEQFNKTSCIANIIGEPFDSKKKIGFQEKFNLISYVGRLDRDKNVAELLEILSQVNLHSDWKLQIVGEGDKREELEKLVKSNNLENKVSFLGNRTVNEIESLLERSKVFVFTSLKEGLPTVLLEAMFCSNVLVAYDCNYGPSDIINKNNGFLIPLRNKDLFREKLQYLLDSPADLERLSHSSYREAQKWKKDKILEQWKKIL
ncbi:glycosyltransferase [Riemerella anatipestifer]|uniref:GalNAc-alpha-(1->4)-GalNAc-alpha-(1->3)-diNAcBac-PP-undecaprenol alpha-1,4-N-acetyl-D-galactosaminyltransferase n=3 Tax=Riemerella anatipestifer TaxID=34085 RepID=A0A1A5HLY6_RIEAN|nr:glycosyltransferase [Riemerella anatipestifer]AQY21719.1 GalNAc-alpha-(1->4)-GalNAc-alpha-(1->3)- diNAcBac-PP-undecaprenol alpha-1,4-N-acetyl-D-galactosaminyltransferase [Riemerella anatipestifer]AZZ58582.1 glycosyltransferase family 4 protein [Riemerella anatipestifer]MBT0552285.1 glycosyltransferase [Riemerella anatipestifer]MBT0554519.1 glycosyltransferase [Riemerella anatipestifer]MCE3025055.1 glycosyltransferase [Riemerella anatipestifer]